MADIKLGLLGAEVTLPQVNAMIGSPPEMPVGYNKQLDRATMVDGTTRHNARTSTPRTFSLSWAQLTAANIAVLVTAAEYNVPLHYQNNWIDATWRWVRVTTLEITPVVYVGTMMYRAQMELEEDI